MTYYLFNVMVRIDGEPKWVELKAINTEAAFADIKEAYAGNVELVTWSQR